MELKTLKISEKDNNIIMRKKPQIATIILSICILFAIVYLSLSDFFEEQSKFFIVFFSFAVVVTVWHHISILFGKIVINKLEQEITICTPIKHTVAYNDIQKIEIVGKDSTKIRFVCSDKVYSFFTGTKNQSKEIEDLVNSYIHIETENEDNEDEL